jgi:hypothetical protein
MVIALLKIIHKRRFPKGRPFGSDLQLLMVYSTACSFFFEGRSVKNCDIARFLGMSHETVRRNLKAAMEIGLIERHDRFYEPTRSNRQATFTKVEKALAQCAEELIRSR